jgi:hypothetical protein
MGAYEAPPCPNVAVSVTTGANSLNVQVTAGGGSISRIRGIPATSSNILVSLNGQNNLPSSFDMPIGGGPTSVPMTLTRENGMGSGTLSFIVTDACSEWTTLAGGGPLAWGGGGGGSPGATAASPPTAPLRPPASSPVPVSTPVAGAACATFPTHAAAQAHPRSNPTDPLVIDRNRNGIACEGADGAGFVNPPLDHVPVPRP